MRRWWTSLVALVAGVAGPVQVLASSPVDVVAPGVSEVRKVSPVAAAPSAPVAQRRLRAIAFETRGESGLRIRLTLDGPTRATGSVREAPDRIAVDLEHTSADAASFPVPPAGGLLADYRFGRIDGDQLRLILELAAPGRIVGFKTDAATGELTLDIAARTGPLDPRDVIVDPALAAAAPVPPPVPPPETPSRRATGLFVVVVDPGHGGIDPGAVSPGGLVEKDVVFAVARALQRELASRPDLRVHMTREADTFVRLADRVRIAADAKADLFVSIHADQFAGITGAAAVRGGSVYVLGDNPASRATAALVARENAVDAVLGLPVDDLSTARDVGSILSDLAARETQDLSLRAQSLLVRDLRGAMTLAREPVRAAAFRVLRQAEVPSVLIELGYMSHVADMAELVSPAWQRRVAVAMARAIDAYRERLRQDRDIGRSPLP